MQLSLTLYLSTACVDISNQQARRNGPKRREGSEIRHRETRRPCASDFGLWPLSDLRVATSLDTI